MSKLVGLQFQIIYKKGVENGAADSLSRMGHLFVVQAISTLQHDWVQEVSTSYVTTQLLQELAIQSPNDNFTGKIPESIYLCNKLNVLQLSFNKLHGQLLSRARHLK